MALMERSATEQGAKFYPIQERQKFWEKFPKKQVHVELKDNEGNTTFEMDVEAPEHWSDNSLRVIASRYLHPYDHASIFRMIDRVCVTFAKRGLELGYFGKESSAARNSKGREFYEDLFEMVYYQRAVWNSPVWFNVGLDDSPQVWACLIAALTDEMDGPTGIGALWETEWRTYKGGSGLGTNYGSLRADGEFLKMKKGQSGGAMRFLRTSDSVAGTIKSGGKNRRAAKMNVMDADHPEIIDFVRSKAFAEDVAHVLMDAGYDVTMNGKHDYLVPYQNANHSVRINGKEFFDAVNANGEWELRWRHDTDRDPKFIRARELWDEINEAAWKSADPGLQFDDHIQSWHTTPSYGRINASNPCSEYLSNDDTVCNLASLNHLAFWDNNDDGIPSFKNKDYQKTVNLLITSMDIAVSISSYPRESIRKNVTDLRQLGLGFANAGAMLMWLGIPYDSVAARNLMAALQSLMLATAATKSADLARIFSPHAAWEEDGERHTEIMERHYQEALKWRRADNDTYATLNWDLESMLSDIWILVEGKWGDALEFIEDYGLRNAQLTVIAPTGTISFLMGCETQGIEPFYSFDAVKTLVGGGQLDLSENRVVEQGLKRLKMLQNAETADFSVWLANHPAFATAMGPDNAMRPEAHVLMMAAVQTGVCGAISKTANLPNSATVSDVAAIYRLAWEVGVKAIALYRDGSKFTQPLNLKKKPTVTVNGNQTFEVENFTINLPSIGGDPLRRPMPWTRKSTTHKFRINGHSYYLTAGFYSDGTLGEIFFTAGSEGTFPSGTLNAFAKAVSIGLQYGIPLRVFAESFIGKAIFEPNGPVISDNEDPSLKFCDSVIDYVFKWLTTDSETGEGWEITWNDVEPTAGTVKINPQEMTIEGTLGETTESVRYTDDICPNCGRMQMVPNGTCLVCQNCGETTGCG